MGNAEGNSAGSSQGNADTPKGTVHNAPKSDLVGDRGNTTLLGEFNRKDIALWGASIFLALIYIMAGIPKLGTIDFMHERFTEVWGYPAWFEYLIGALEFVGGIFLLIPSTAFYAASGLGIIMLGAIYTHLALGNPVFTFIPAICLALLAFIAYERRPGREEHHDPIASGRTREEPMT